MRKVPKRSQSLRSSPHACETDFMLSRHRDTGFGLYRPGSYGVPRPPDMCWCFRPKLYREAQLTHWDLLRGTSIKRKDFIFLLELLLEGKLEICASSSEDIHQIPTRVVDAGPGFHPENTSMPLTSIRIEHKPTSKTGWRPLETPAGHFHKPLRLGPSYQRGQVTWWRLCSTQLLVLYQSARARHG